MIDITDGAPEDVLKFFLDNAEDCPLCAMEARRLLRLSESRRREH